MSEFSDLFRLYIHTKNVPVSSMAQYLSIDRSNLYKMINGKRLPTRKVAEELANYMSLTLAEQAEFLEAYRIEEIGKESYYQRLSALHFLLNCHSVVNNDINQGTLVRANAYANLLSEIHLPEGCIPLNGVTHINQMLSLMCRQVEIKESAHIRVVAQPTWGYLMSLLQGIGHLNLNLKIDQLICLNTGDEPRKQKGILYNIDCFEKILPMFHCACKYTPHFYYDNVDSHFNSLHLFSNIILTDDYALVCSSDMTQGILCHQGDIQKLYTNYFEQQLAMTKEMFAKVELGTDIQGYMQVVQKYYGIAIDAFPCMVQCAPPELLMKILKGGKGFQDELLNHIKNLENLESAFQNQMTTFTNQGMKYFMEHGRILNYPDELYYPIPMENRVQLLKRFAQCQKERNIHLMKGKLSHLSLGCCVYMNLQGGTLGMRTMEGKLVYLQIKDKNLLNALYELATHLEEEDYVYSLDETHVYLDEMIRRYS